MLKMESVEVMVAVQFGLDQIIVVLMLDFYEAYCKFVWISVRPSLIRWSSFLMNEQELASVAD